MQGKIFRICVSIPHRYYKSAQTSKIALQLDKFQFLIGIINRNIFAYERGLRKVSIPHRYYKSEEKLLKMGHAVCFNSS